MYICSFSYSFPLWFIIGYEIQFSVLYCMSSPFVFLQFHFLEKAMATHSSISCLENPMDSLTLIFKVAIFASPPPSVIPYSRAVLMNILGQLSSFDWNGLTQAVKVWISQNTHTPQSLGYVPQRHPINTAMLWMTEDCTWLNWQETESSSMTNLP